MPHYFSKNQTSQKRPKEIRYTFNNHPFIFHTSSGVFSKDHLDKGTLLLLKECQIKENTRVLDLGCGYGVVGIVTKALHNSCEVVLSDVNKRALDLARKNAKENKVKVSVIESDRFEKLRMFDTILLNPPQHAGKETCFLMIEESIKHLNKNGSLQMVARHQKGGKHLSEKMKEVFGNLTVLGKGSGFRVYQSEHL